MIIRVTTVGETATQLELPSGMKVNNGMRLLAREANSGDVYVGDSDAVTTTTGNLVPQGAPGTTQPYTIPADHFNASREIWIVGSAAGQIVDWSAD